jgi:hypothetical protein
MRLLILWLFFTTSIVYSQDSTKTTDSISYEVVASKLLEYFEDKYDFRNWPIVKDESKEGEYTAFEYRQCDAPECTILKYYDENGLYSAIDITEFHKDKKGRTVSIHRAYEIEKDGFFQSPQLGFHYQASRDGKRFGKVNKVSIKAGCDNLKRVNKDVIFISSYNEMKEICETYIFYLAIP